MKYSEFLTRNHFDKIELLAFSQGNLIEDPPGEIPKLPAPPFLLIDRITKIEKYNRKGIIIAEKDILIDEWFFQCHFRDDPVMPGSLGLDAIWQLIGFFCAYAGSIGNGRALGVENVEFEGQVRPYNILIQYKIEIQRYSELKEQGISIALGNGELLVDGETIYRVKNARVGIFKQIAYRNYPLKTKNHFGGLLKK